jgi:hypothetical protein
MQLGRIRQATALIGLQRTATIAHKYF